MTELPPEEWPAETTAVAVPLPPPVVPPPEPGNRIGQGMLLAIGFLILVVAVIAAIVLTRHRGQRAASTTVVITTTKQDGGANGTAAVPNVVGQSSHDASKALRAAGLSVSLIHVPSSLPAGTIVSESPSPGSRVAKNSGVLLNVSTGPNKGATRTNTKPQTTDKPTTSTATSPTPASATVPALSGDLQPALQRLDDAGFLATIAYVPSNDRFGTVIAQSPSANATTRPDSHVTINVSSGPKGTADHTVPDVVGQKIPGAVQTLHDAGLRLLFLRTNVSDKSQAGTIVAQTPLPGAHVPKNAQVLVYMGAYRVG